MLISRKLTVLTSCAPLYSPLCLSLSILFAIIKGPEWDVKQKLWGFLCSLVWYLIIEDEVLHWDESRSHVSWNSSQIKFSSGTSGRYQNWKGLHPKFTETFFNFDMSISLCKLNFRQAILFWEFNLYALNILVFFLTFVLMNETQEGTKSFYNLSRYWISSDGVQNEITCFRGRQRWRCSRRRRRAGCSLPPSTRPHWETVTLTYHNGFNTTYFPCVCECDF